MASALHRLRTSAADRGVCEAKIAALFTCEAERVADAGVLAEILLPLLRDFAPPVLAPASFARLARPVVSDPVLSRRPPVPAPGIADFIDEMIQQDRAAPGPARP